MQLISCRKDFEDRNEWAPEGLLVSYTGGDIFQAYKPEGNVVGEFIQVHGYNTEAKNVYDAYRSNVTLMDEEFFGYPRQTGFLWPGLGETWLESLLFHKAQRYADASAGALAQYISKSGSKHTTVMTHSLGARVALEAVRKYKVKIDVLALTGPAVDCDCFEPGKAYDECLPYIGKLLVFYSKNDPVLARVYRDDQFKNALGALGPRTPNPAVLATDMSLRVHAHSDYRYDRAMWRAIQAVRSASVPDATGV